MNFAGACHVEPDGYGGARTPPARTSSWARANPHMVRHAIDDFRVRQQRLGFLVIDRRRRNPVGHGLGKGCVTEPLALKAEIVLGNKSSGPHGCQTQLNRSLNDLFALRSSRHHDGLPRRLRSALTARIDVGIAVGNGDVGETGPPICADEAAVRLVTFELVDDLEKRQRSLLAVARLDGELAGVFTLPVPHFGHVLQRDAEFLGDEKFGAGELGARGAGNFHRQHDLLGHLRERHQVLHLANGLDLARHPHQCDALEARIAKQLKIGCQAVARLPAADHLILAVGDKGLRHPWAVRVSPHDDHGIGQPRAQRGEHERRSRAACGRARRGRADWWTSRQGSGGICRSSAPPVCGSGRRSCPPRQGWRCPSPDRHRGKANSPRMTSLQVRPREPACGRR